MATLYKELPNRAFPHEVDELDISTSNETKVELRYNGKTMFSSNLFPIDGKIELRDIASLLDSYLSEDLCTFEVWLDDAAADSTDIIPCRVRLDCNADDMDSVFLTRTTEKYTHRYAQDFIPCYKVTSDLLYAEIIIRNRESGEVTMVSEKGNVSASGIIELDCSGFFDSIDEHYPGYDIVQYTVELGKSKITHRVIPDGMADNLHDFGFINSFNQREHITLMGAASRDMKVERRSAIIGGQYRNFDVESVPYWTIKSGMMLDGMAGLFDDLISATKVWRLADDVQMAVTDSEFKNPDDNASACQGSVTLRETKRKYRHHVTKQVRTFDITFDETFQ